MHTFLNKFHKLNFYLEKRLCEVKSPEELKSEDQLSQSPISGNPSPFIGSISDFRLLRALKERVIRSKSNDNFC